MRETVLGVSLPILLLVLFEVVYSKKSYWVLEDVLEEEGASAVDERAHGKCQSALAIKAVAFLLLILLFIRYMISGDVGSFFVIQQLAYAVAYLAIRVYCTNLPPPLVAGGVAESVGIVPFSIWY